MPPVVAAVVIAGTLAALEVITIYAAIAMVASAVLSYASQALAKKPKSSSAGGVADFSRDRTVSVRQPITPWQIIYGETRTGGAFTYIKSTDSNQYLNLLITIAGHEIDSIQAVYFDDEQLVITPAGSGRFTVGGRFAGWAEIWYGYGDDGDEETALLADLTTNSGGEWTSAHRQSGRAKLYVRLKFNQDIYPTGIPNISAVIRGRKVYDPREDSTAWSSNVALCVTDYLTNSSFGLAADYDEEISEDELIEAANICDEEVDLADTGTEPRYASNGSFETDEKPSDVIVKLLTAMAGKTVFLGGLWKVYAGAYRVPTVTLDETDARGPITVQTKVSRRENFNAVKGVFFDPLNHWQPTDFPPVTNSTYLAEDNNERVWKDIELPFTTSSSMAQRLAKIDLEAARQQITVTYPSKLSAYRLETPDVVGITNARRGWSDKPFELVEGVLSFDAGDDGVPVPGFDLLFRETASAVFDWNSGEETTVDPAPDTDLPNPFLVQPPGAITVTEEIYITRSGDGVKAKAVLEWGSSPDGFLRDYEVEFKLASESVWRFLEFTSATVSEILDIAPGSYQFRVTAINQLGVRSDPSTASKSISALSEAPAAPVNLTISAIGGLAILRWAPAAELDVRIGGQFEVRHSGETSGATVATSVSIGESVPGISTISIVPLKPGTYLVRARDSSGNYSPASSVVTTQATVLTFANVGSVTEDPGFTGDKIDVIEDSGHLELDGEVTGTYFFAAGIDLGSVQRVRLTSAIEAAVVNVNDTIGSRLTNMSTWESFSGVVTGSADCRVFVRTTDGDPGDSPVTWSEWQRLDSAEFNSRAFEFKAELTTDDVDYNILVTGLSVSVDEVA